jgi:hypothetical protein
MTDIFGTDSKLAGVFKGTSFALSVGGGNGSFQGALVQQLQISYRRQLTRVWELGSRDQYYIEGHTEGQGSLQRIVGPQGLADNVIKNLADVCGAQSRVVTLSAQNNTCTGSDGGVLTLTSPTVTGVSYGADVGNFLINAGVEMIFVALNAA